VWKPLTVLLLLLFFFFFSSVYVLIFSAKGFVYICRRLCLLARQMTRNVYKYNIYNTTHPAHAMPIITRTTPPPPRCSDDLFFGVAKIKTKNLTIGLANTRGLSIIRPPIKCYRLLYVSGVIILRIFLLDYAIMAFILSNVVVYTPHAPYNYIILL